MNGYRNIILMALVYIGSAILAALGGWDVFLQWLLVFTLADFVLGTAVGRVIKRETFDGLKFWRGLVLRLGYAVAIVLSVGVQECALARGVDFHGYLRLTMMTFLLGRESQSILKHLKALGLDVPTGVRDAITQMQEKHDKAKRGSEEVNP